jgi:hypothetical protein
MCTVPNEVCSACAQSTEVISTLLALTFSGSCISLFDDEPAALGVGDQQVAESTLRSLFQVSKRARNNDSSRVPSAFQCRMLHYCVLISG